MTDRSSTDPTRRIRLVVLFGGQSAEHDVSCVTATHVLAAASSDRYDIEPIGITREGRWVRADEAAAALDRGADALPDSIDAQGPEVDPLPVVTSTSDQAVVVFPLLHGPMGEDGTVQGLLELADVPYVGAGVLGSALAMDKIKAKEVCTTAQIPQVRYVGRNADALDETEVSRIVAELGFPLFVKPANLGSSIGVSRVAGADELGPAIELASAYDEWILFEEGIGGREIEVAVLGNHDPRSSVPGEVRSGADFYDYEDKYVDGRAELLVPAPLSDDEIREVRVLAIDAFVALRAEGMARVDFFLESPGRGFLLNEINTIPGFTPISMYPKLWEETGLAYPDLIDELVRLAVERHDRRHPRRVAGRRPSLNRHA